jgi:hypothetical protein
LIAPRHLNVTFKQSLKLVEPSRKSVEPLQQFVQLLDHGIIHFVTLLIAILDCPLAAPASRAIFCANWLSGDDSAGFVSLTCHGRGSSASPRRSSALRPTLRCGWGAIFAPRRTSGSTCRRASRSRTRAALPMPAALALARRNVAAGAVAVGDAGALRGSRRAEEVAARLASTSTTCTTGRFE